MVLLAACALVFCLSTDISFAAQPPKKLIEFGWDEPSTSFLRAHIRDMEQMPFDGCVFHVEHKLPAGGQIRFTWDAWGKRTFTAAELQPALDDLKATRIEKFRYNFLRFNVTPGDIDWFDEFSPVVNNAREAAKLTRAGRAKGILFDVEPYNAPVFDFSKQRLANSKTWEQYQAQARLRGQEVMEGFQAGYPGLTVFLTFGYSIAWAQMANGKRTLEQCQYGLLPAFLDGMIDKARGRTRVVDGCELAYGYKDTSLFRKEYDTMYTGLLPIVADPERYHAVVSLGFGLWLDHNSHKRPWDTTDFSKNSYTPEQFQASLRQALQVCDEYVWVYTEKPRWWTEVGQNQGGGSATMPTNLPAAYINAVRAARAAVNDR